MKYRKTGFAIALPFWITAMLQMLCVLYPQSYVVWFRYQPFVDGACLGFILLVYLWQRKTYQLAGDAVGRELHAGHVFGIAGAFMKIIAEGFYALHTTALLLSGIALILLLISLLLLLQTEPYEKIVRA